MLKRNQPSKIIFALDSDVLIAMTYCYYLDDNTNNEFIEKQDALKNVKKRQVIKKLLELHKAGEIGFFIPPSVYLEWRHAPTVKRFIKENCMMPEVDSDGKFVGFDEVMALADLYIRPVTYTDELGNEIKQNPPMKSEIDPSSPDLYKPTKDVYHMAWASIYGFNLLTNNFSDFITYGNHIISKKSNKEAMDTNRRRNIRLVNEQQGLILTKREGKNIIPSPYGISDLFGIITNSTLDFPISSEEGVQSASSIIDCIEKTYKLKDEMYGYDNSSVIDID